MHAPISTDDVRIEGLRALVTPDSLIERLLPTTEDVAFVASCRQQTESILARTDDRLLVIVGPCSIHDEAAALEYAELLRVQAERFSDDLLVVMRVYFEKPRTTVGWKGFINDPGLDETYDINLGLELARKLLLQLTQLKVAAATEFLDTITPQYIADLVTWGAIGARTVESQVHRQLASGLSMAVGFKNGTKGNIDIALDAIRAARGSHQFLSVTKDGRCAIVKTRGNNTCHVILRGGSDGPNYSPEHLAAVSAALTKAGLVDSIMVDCSHGNSNKDHRNQPSVARALADQIAQGNHSITGVMIESHLVEGRQEAKPGQSLAHGQSITDACINWDDTVPVLENLAAAVRARREGHSV
jgi:3-deoxy-7-phosphoheptulonate synthase